MAGRSVKSLGEALKALNISSSTCRQALWPIQKLDMAQKRTMATEASIPNLITSLSSTPDGILATRPTLWQPQQSVPVTIHSFPSLEPKGLETWSTKHLYLPLRRDILHQAVVFEGNKTRQGTASTKSRWEVYGSGRKLMRQKGSGRARVGDRKSPIRVGGGVSHGPHPRDFSTRLNRKVYDLAWRTALSYRYRRGELVVVRDGMELPLPQEFLKLAASGRLGAELEDGWVARYVRSFLRGLEWGHDHGRTTFVTTERRPNLFTSLDAAGGEGRALEMNDVDVKDLLETGRIVVERSALLEMLRRHESDLVSKIFINGARVRGPEAVHEVVI